MDDLDALEADARAARPIPREHIGTGCGPGGRVMREDERRAVDEQRGADRMARAMVAALYWRAGEYDRGAEQQAKRGNSPTPWRTAAAALHASAIRAEKALDDR